LLFSITPINMKKAACFSFAFSIGLTCMCQSYIMRTESLIQPVLINPAICGADLVPKANLSYEKQWLKIPQSPSSFYVSGEMRLGKFDFYNPRMFINDARFRSLERVGLGAGIYSDNNGPFHEINLVLTYAYHLPLNESTALSFGISAKINHYGVNSSEIDPVTYDDPLIHFENHTDMNTSVGTYIYHNEFFAGISGVNLFNTAASPMNFASHNQILYGLGGFQLRNENRSIILEPSITFRYYLIEHTNAADFHLKLYLTKYGWISFSYLSTSQMEFILALRVHKMYYFAYKFTAAQKQLSPYTNYTHGIMLGINLGVNRNTSIIY
jgi:type IX secretion system PorP/SprF family membrane protein